MVSDMKAELTKEAARIEEDALHSGKGHLNAADCWAKIHRWMGLPSTVLAALAAFSIKNSPECAAVLAFLSAAFGAAFTFLNPSEHASTHRTIGGQYLSLKNDARTFANIKLQLLDDAAAVKEFEELSSRRNKLNESGIDIPRWAYEKAVKDVNNGRNKYAVDKEGK
jgi:hypothetical protein